MFAQQLFYILGSVYILLNLGLLLIILITVIVVVRVIITTKRRWALEAKNRKLWSSKTLRAALPLIISLVATWSIKRFKKTITKS